VPVEVREKMKAHFINDISQLFAVALRPK
jgi:hypothetical protein